MEIARTARHVAPVRHTATWRIGPAFRGEVGGAGVAPDGMQQHLEEQLIELASLRRELQGLYESTYTQLHEAREEAASERVQREGLAADNATLRQWNAQLGEELSVLVAELHQDAEDLATECAADPAHAGAEVPPVGPEAASSHDGAGGSPNRLSAELSRANAAVLSRLVGMRQSGSERERHVARRLVARLMASGSGVLREEVRRISARAGEPAEPTVGPGPPAGAAGAQNEWRDAVPSADADGSDVEGALPSARQIAAEQQLQLELAALSVRHVAAHARLRIARREAREGAARVATLQQSGAEVLADLNAATRRIGALESRISEQADASADLDALRSDHARTLTEITSAQSALRDAHAQLEAGRARCASLEDRLGAAKRVVARQGEQTAEATAALHALSADSRALLQENVSLRLLARELGATPAELDRARRTLQLPDLAVGVGGAARRRAGRGADTRCAGTRHVAGGLHAHAGDGAAGLAASSSAPEIRPEIAEISAEIAEIEPEIACALSAEPHAAMAQSRRIDASGALASMQSLQQKLTRVRSAFAEVRQQTAKAVAAHADS